MTMLVTGGTGKLGQQLRRVFPNASFPSKQELDIRNKRVVEDHLREKRPDTVIHAAALTGIRQCEEDKELAWKTNVEGTENLLEASRSFVPSAYFLYVSTACVFYGDRGAYSESDIPNPKNFYALTKLLGEAAVRNSGLSRWLIVRTNFVPREKWPYPRAFVDRFGSYLFADDAALALKSVFERGLKGIVHVTGRRRMSMYDLARITTRDVSSMSLKDYQGPPLTVDMTLKSNRIESFELREGLTPLAG